MTATRPKVLVVSGWAPPMHGGAPVVLARLLGSLPSGSYCIFTNKTGLFQRSVKTGEWLPEPYFFLDRPDGVHGDELTRIGIPEEPGASTRGAAGFPGVVRAVATSVVVPRVMWRIYFRTTALLREIPSIDTVLVTSDDGTFLVPGVAAARRAGRRLVVYLFDIYGGNALPGLKGLFAAVFDGFVVKSAATIVVTNNHALEFLRSKYGPSAMRKVTVLHHPAPAPKALPAVTEPDGKLIEILYTGTIDWPQLDALRGLVNASRDLTGVRVTILAPYGREQLASWGLSGLHVHADSVSLEEVERRQATADILFLPMAFHPKSRSIARTAAPAKIAEYLRSGKPVLVYAPQDTHVARYANDEGFGVVVSREDPEALREALRSLARDRNMRTTLARNAVRTYLKNHRLENAVQQFRDIVLRA